MNLNVVWALVQVSTLLSVIQVVIIKTSYA